MSGVEGLSPESRAAGQPAAAQRGQRARPSSATLGSRLLALPARVLVGLDGGPVLAVIAAVGLYAWLCFLVPGALTYNGFNLTLSSAMPLLFVALGQMVIVSLGDLDLGTGYGVGLVNCVTAVIVTQHALVGYLALVGIVIAYGLMGALVEWRALPAIIVTLGASFVWLGLALLAAPTPKGSAPAWLVSFANWNPPILPLPVLIALVVSAVGGVIVGGFRPGVLLRAVGSNPAAARSFGIRVGRVRVIAYLVGGVCVVIAGLLLTGITQAGDPNASGDFTLLSIAAVILGGGDFRGGRASVVGVVFAALALSLVSPVLSVLGVPSRLHSAAVGLVLVSVIAARRALKR